jgi:cullin 2
MLARRLINQQSTSIDAEEFMVTKLKQTCGYEFTGKLARMFQDIKVSDDLNMKFLDYLKSESSTSAQNQTMTNLIGVDFNIYVLQVTINQKNSNLKFLF